MEGDEAAITNERAVRLEVLADAVIAVVAIDQKEIDAIIPQQLTDGFHRLWRGRRTIKL